MAQFWDLIKSPYIQHMLHSGTEQGNSELSS